MKMKEESTIQVIEKARPHPRLVFELSKMVKRVVDHKTLQKIIQLTEEEEGID